MPSAGRNDSIFRAILGAKDRIAHLLGDAWPEFEQSLESLLARVVAAESVTKAGRIIDEIVHIGLSSSAAGVFREILRTTAVDRGSREKNVIVAPSPAPPPPPAAAAPRNRPRSDVGSGASAIPRGPAKEVAVVDEDAESDDPPPTFVAFTFEDVAQPKAPRVLPPDEGLTGNSFYRLKVGISLTPDPRFAAPTDQPTIDFPEKDQTAITLHVVAYVRGSALKLVGEPLDTIEWAGSASSKDAEFTLETSDVLDREKARLEVFFYYRSNLLYAARFTVEVAPDGEAWVSGGRPIAWAYLDDSDRNRSPLFRRFADLGRLSERALNIAVQRGEDAGEYLLTAFLGRAELPARVTISRNEVAGALVRMRGLMDDLRREPLYIEGGYDANGEYVGDMSGKEGGRDVAGNRIPAARVTETFNAFMKDMATLGSQLSDNLFATDSARLVRDAIQQHLRDGDVVQIWIDRDAHDFVYPWSWLYDRRVEPGKRHVVEQTAFWGSRFVIEQLPEYPETIGRALPEAIAADPLLHIRVGVFPFEKTTERQRSFFRTLGEVNPQRIDQQVWDADDAWEAYLPMSDGQILYFFTHGHTAKPATIAGQQAYDMIGAWKAWLGSGAADESEGLKLYRERGLAELQELEGDHALLDETHIRLAHGRLLLRELREMARLEKGAPLVFLNMCESAQVFPTISEGLIDVFLKRGARTVIGTEMPMLPHFADLFSRRFFERFLYRSGTDGASPDAGAVLLELRRTFLNQKNPLGFAYTLFGDARVRLEHGLSAPTPSTGAAQ